VLRGLLDKQLVKIVGRAEVPGRPMLYGTTKRFLEVFGLACLEDLPSAEELRIGAKDTPDPHRLAVAGDGDANADEAGEVGEAADDDADDDVDSTQTPASPTEA